MQVERISQDSHRENQILGAFKFAVGGHPYASTRNFDLRDVMIGLLVEFLETLRTVKEITSAYNVTNASCYMEQLFTPRSLMNSKEVPIECRGIVS